jgi:hypothetical protein
MGIQTQKLDKEMNADALNYVAVVIQNNPLEVKQRLRSIYGEVVNVNDPDGMFEAIQSLCVRYPDQAAEILYNCLSVDVIDANLTDVEQDWVLEKVIAADTLFPGMNKNLPVDPIFEDVNNLAAGSTGSGASTTSGGNINWGGIITAALPGILGAFGIANPNANPNTPALPPRRDNTWLWIGLLIILAIVAMVLIARKK